MKELRQQAIRLLARREHTHAELRKKLAREGTAEEIEAVLTDLASCGLLSDERAAASYLRGHSARFGASRLRQTLRTKGIDEDTIAASLESAELPDELERARAVWQHKFRVAPQDQREWARQARFLQSRGFSTDLIRRLLKEQDPA
ncbi:MAG: regulatory protein RecX [Georgfuchsia sp.]